MKKTQGEYSVLSRILALVLVFVMLAGYFPTTGIWEASAAEANGITTVADPETLTRPAEIYGDNTLNAGKVTVGKSVSTESVTVNGQTVTLTDPDNFLVTITQTAQVAGLSSETSVPVDVVFVLDTSGSMGHNNQENKNGRAEAMVEAANKAISTLLAANEYNRIGVVAFSSAEYGGGTSNDNAANVLSPLHHYTGNAATKHLQWVTDNKTAYTGDTSKGSTKTGTTGRDENKRATYNFGVGSDYYLIGGRTTTGAVGNTRDGGDGGTNIHAGIALGARQLTGVTDTTVTYEDGTTVTRMPFIVLLSDGAPTFSSSTQKWYEPSQTAEQGPGNSSYPGNGFLAALTAAYYKGIITEHYFGDKADNHNRCSIYTIGVQLESQTNKDDVDLAQLTMNPKQYLSDTTNTYADDFTSYWNNYQAGTNNFNVLVNYTQEWRNVGNNWNPNWQWVNVDPIYYTVRSSTFEATSNYVNGKDANGNAMYTGGIQYNDGYYNASQTSEIAGIFDDIVAEISKKAISVPTKVDAYGEDFSGYVTFTDPIGEYMEVKDMKGILADGYFYQGASAAAKLASGADAEFNALMEDVLKTRMSMTSSTGVTTAELLATADGNSITWWGKTYDVSGEEDVGMQVVGAAADDSIEYITDPATTIPAGADHVCRSYFFYGEAGGANQDPEHEYLYFVVRVQRSLTAPYQQTVVISAPASLLSMEKVLITENADGTYTASVEEALPARVVYEVGLRSDITAENVATIVSEDYKNETVNGTGSANYDAATDSYRFFTNDWDRSESTGSHHRAQAKATFDAAADNSFYTYQEDTLIVDGNGNAVTSDPKGTTAYYVRTYYEWGTTADASGNFTATPKTALIQVEIPADAELVEKDGKWYIPKGAYTGSTLVVNGDDAGKSSNTTGTASVASHPHRTGDPTNSHYTVLLGNNGMLTLKADTPKPEKTVQVNSVVDADGKEVKVGDVLTYSISVKNALEEEAVYTVTDKVPAGTEFVSADNGGTLKDGVVTWSVKIGAGETKAVSFQVKVTQDALDTAVVPGAIRNTAVVTFPNGAQYSTNPVENPPYGKEATDASGNDTADQDGYKVGDIITYSIRYHNNAKNSAGEYVAADITITDKIPAGTELVTNNPISHGGTVENGVITWNLTNVQPNMAGVVTFRVRITADAVSPVTNSAEITVGNDPKITTNPTETKILKGELVLTKTVAEGDDKNKEFTLTLTESTGRLNGTFETLVTGVVTGETGPGPAVFSNGSATLTIKHGWTVTIKGLPAGVAITVAEQAPDGWTAAYDGAATVTPVTIDPEQAQTVNIHNDYHAKPVVFQLKGTKAYVGEKFPADATFTFRATQCNADGTALTGAAPITVTATVTSPSGEIVFSSREFTGEMDRYYKITEDASSIPGLITDGTAYYLHLKVTDNQAGQLELAAQISTDAVNWKTFDPTKDTISFTNTYPDPVSINLGGSKTLTGRHQTEGEFNFQLLVPDDGQVGSGSATVIDTAHNVPGTDGHNGTFAFDPITYTPADMVNADGTIATEKTFHYYIREVPGDASFTTYDPAYYVVTVTVKNVNGKLTASQSVVRYENAAAEPAAVDSIAFANTFNVQDTRVTLTGTKALTGRTLQAGEFSFSVYKADEQGNYSETLETLVASGVNQADGAIAFSPIGFTIADMAGAAVKDFYFVVKEDRPEADGATFDPNMYYDPAEYLVKVTVTYNAKTGELSAKIDESAPAIAFTNIQNPSTITVSPMATKKITGENLPEGLKFSFKVEPVSGGADAATGTSAPIGENYAAGSAINVDFTSMVYSYDVWNANKDAQGVATFRYWIMESNTGSAGNGVEYAKARYLYEVKVSRSGTNALVTTETYYKQNEGVADGNTDPANYTTVIAAYSSTESSDARAAFVNAVKNAVVFTNQYNAETSINLTARKQMNGMELEGQEFDFLLQRLDQNGALTGSEVSGSNDANGVIRFATLNYSSAMLDEAYKHEDGAYYFSYLLSEVKPADVAIPGVTYDETRYIVTIKVTQAEGEDGTAGTLKAELAAVSTAVKSGDTYAPGTPAPGFTAEGSTNVTFTNTYSVQQGTDVTIEATKTLTGRDFVMSGENGDIGEFGFALFRQDTADPEIWHNIGTAFNDQNGSISFTRHYNATTLSHMSNAFSDVDNDGKEEFVVIYRINEINGGLGGVTYSGAEYYVKVVIEHDEANSKYVRESVNYYTDAACTNAAEKVEFANTYATNDTGFVPTASKELIGAELSGYNFSFEIVETNENGTAMTDATGAAVVAATGRNNGTDKVTFDEVIFNGQRELNHEGNIACTNAEHGGNCEYHKHYFMIRENAGAASGITYDSGNYYITVEIHDNGAGELSVENVTYYSDAFQTRIDAADVVFTNHYGPGSANLDLQVNKTVKVEYPQAQTFALRSTPVIDPGAEYELEGSEFDFEVYEADSSYQITNTTAVASGTNGAGSGEATVQFTTITYTREDAYENGIVVSGTASSQTYYYVIKELAPSEDSVPGVTIDTKQIHVAVTVTDDGYGNMTATPVYVNDDRTFTNTYAVKEPTTVILTAAKELIGKDMESFSFQLKKDGQVLQTKENDGSLVTFDPLTFYLPGTYTYTVSEVKGSNENMTYDPTVYTVTIKVWDDREGELYAEVTMTKPGEDGASAPAELMQFTNRYEHPDLVVDLSTQIDAEKTVAGADGQELSYLLQKYQFQFEVIDLQGNAVKDANGEEMIGLTNADGSISFPQFRFETSGEYHYLIREKAAYADQKITADDQVWCAHIKVVYDRAEGILKIDPAGCTTHLYNTAHDVEQAYENPVFVNKYEPENVSVTVVAGKKLVGRELRGSEFTFRLLDENGYIASEARNHSDGTVTFQLSYELADLAGKSEETFTYKLVEVIPDAKLGGVTYSNESAVVTVKVTDGQEGKLTASVSGNGATFTNTYNAEEVTAVIEAVKNLEGRPLNADEFSFYLKDANGNTVKDAEGKDLIAKNDAEGRIRFELTFTQDMLDVDDKGSRIATTFDYTIHEVNDGVPGVTYDEASFAAAVTVRDDFQGKLVAATTYAEGAVPVFNNLYNTDDAVVTIQAAKKLTGKNLAGGDFEFQLLGEDGSVVATAKNDADGNIRFSITLSEVGEYSFTIRETAHTDAHYSHDDRTYAVTVKVHDNGEGKLVAEAPVYAQTPVFENTYTPDSIRVTVEASKKFAGTKALKANDFEFQLLDAQNEAVATARNATDGKISFQLNLDAVGTYTYTMVEKAGSDPQITYDTNKYTVTIQVTNENGVLTAAVTYDTDDGKAPVFQNTWKPAKIGVPLTGTKTLTGRNLRAGEFKFEVRDSSGTLVAVGTNDAKGKINFTEVNIVSEGTYLLTVSEAAGSDKNVTYDKTTFQVKIVVEDVDGVLVPTVTYLNGDIAFKNTYKKPVNPETGDGTPIFWMIGLMALSAFAIVLLVIFRPRKGGKYAK